MSGEVFLMGNSIVTKAAGVIRVSYPANSTLVVKGTSSGKQFAKDTNTTSSAKAYIFLAPIGDASYTLTATNTAGKTVSKQVYVAKDQVQSVVLAYELILFNNGIIGGIKWDASKVDAATYCTNSVSDVIHLSGMTYDNGTVLVAPSATRGISSAIDLTNYNKVNVRVKQVLSNTGTAKIYVGTSALGDQTATANITLTAGQTSSLDISSVTGSKYISIYVRPTGGTYANSIDVKFDKVWLE